MMRSAFWKTNPRLGRLRLRHLDALQVLEHSTSFHEAAQTLGISQPTVSALVRDVEDAFGVRLYERAHSGIQPTEFALVATDRVRRLLAEAESLFGELQSLSATGQSKLRVGAIAQVMLTFAPCLLGENCFSSSNLALEFHEAPSESLFDQLADRDLDCVIGPPPSVLPDDYDNKLFKSEKLYTYRPLVIARPDHPLWTDGIIGMIDLTRYRWALPSPHTAVGRYIARAFDEVGVTPPQPVVQLPSIAYGIRFAAESEMLACISWPAWSNCVDGQRLRAALIPIPIKSWDISLTWREDLEISAVTRLLKVIKSLAWMHEVTPIEVLFSSGPLSWDQEKR